MKWKHSPINNLEKPFELKIYNYWLFIAAVLVTIFFFEFLYKIIFSNEWKDFTTVLIDAFLLLLVMYLFLLFFKPKTVLKIGKQGIWTKNGGWIEWINVKSFYIEKTFIRGHIYLSLFLALNNMDNEISVVISNDRIIRKNIQLYKGDCKIVDMGNKEQEFDHWGGKIIKQNWHSNK